MSEGIRKESLDSGRRTPDPPANRKPGAESGLSSGEPAARRANLKAEEGTGSRPRIALITPEHAGGDKGGAERLYEGLRLALFSAGVSADLLPIRTDESTFSSIQESLLRFYDLDLSSYDGVISTKTPSYCVRHPNHVCYLVHTMRVFYDMFEIEYPNPTQEKHDQRSLIQQLDTGFLARTRRLFAIGHEVRERLLRWNGLDAEVLHPGVQVDAFKPGRFDFVFIPSRLHRWKRIDLVIQAFRHVSAPVRLKIAGIGEDAPSLKQLAEGDSRIEFLGYISDRELVENYSNALVVPFCPVREDYGYVTLEAFLSEKPVITCEDSGEPKWFVKDGINGFVCPPDPRAIAERIDRLYSEPGLAYRMGRSGKESISHIRWDDVARSLLGALNISPSQ